MKVQSVFHPTVECLGPAATLTTAATLMRAGEFGSVAIYENDRLAGILTETDIVRAVAEHRDPDTTTLSEFMSVDPVTAEPDDDTTDVALRMIEGGFRHLPVVENGRLIGMVSSRDLLQLEAWPVADSRLRSGTASIDHPERPRRGRLIEPEVRR